MKKLISLLLGTILFLITGCGTQSSGSSSGGGGATLRIPASNHSAPSGILDQLSWAGAGGGPRGSCESCGGYINGNQMILQGFEPNQNLAGMLYRFTGGDACGNTTAEFITSFGAQVNANGYLEVELLGTYRNVFVYELYDRGTGELLVGWPIGGAYPCP